MRRTQAKILKLKHGRFAGLEPQNRPGSYESSRYFTILTFSTALKRNSGLPPAVRDDDFESLKWFSVDVFRSVYTPKKYRASLFFPVEKVTFPREAV